MADALLNNGLFAVEVLFIDHLTVTLQGTVELCHVLHMPQPRLQFAPRPTLGRHRSAAGIPSTWASQSAPPLEAVGPGALLELLLGGPGHRKDVDLGKDLDSA